MLLLTLHDLQYLGTANLFAGGSSPTAASACLQEAELAESAICGCMFDGGSSPTAALLACRTLNWQRLLLLACCA
jgi:glutamate/tyrosine decarboxylase-like PLP-dependent enzyme